MNAVHAEMAVTLVIMTRFTGLEIVRTAKVERPCLKGHVWSGVIALKTLAERLMDLGSMVSNVSLVQTLVLAVVLTQPPQ